LPSALAGLPLVCKGCAQRFVPAAQPAAPPPAAPPPPAPKIERSIAPPAPKPDAPKPPPKPVAPAAQVEPPKPEPKPVPPSAADTATATGGNDVLVSKPDSTPDIDFNVGGPTAASLSDANRQKPKGLSSADVAVPRPASDTDRDTASVPELDLDQLARARTEAELEVQSKPPEARARTEADLVLPVPPTPKALPKREPRRAPQPKPQPQPQPEPAPEPAARSGLIPFAADLFALVLLLAGGMLAGEMIVQKHTGAVLANAAENPIEAVLWGTVPLLLALVYVLLAGRGLSLGARLRGK
jgi:hypothetical protein